MNQEQSLVSLPSLLCEPIDTSERVYRIGDLAREFDVTLRTLRFYEDRKMIIPARSGSTRLYTANDRQRLKLILLAKRIGFSLSEIEGILKVDDQESVSKECLGRLVDKLKGQVPVLNKQIKDAQAARDELDETVAYLEDQL